MGMDKALWSRGICKNGVIDPGVAADNRKIPVFLEMSDGAAQQAAFGCE